MVESVLNITPELLEAKGIAALLLDIDGTLMPSKKDNLSIAVQGWIDEMKSRGIALYLLSNSKRKQRVIELGEKLDIPYAFLARKPGKKGYFAAFRTLGLDHGKIAMVGDQIFTDVFGANRARIRSFLVESTDTDLWYQPLRRIFEKPFMKETGL